MACCHGNVFFCSRPGTCHTLSSSPGKASFRPEAASCVPRWSLCSSRRDRTGTAWPFPEYGRQPLSRQISLPVPSSEATQTTLPSTQNPDVLLTPDGRTSLFSGYKRKTPAFPSYETADSPFQCCIPAQPE